VFFCDDQIRKRTFEGILCLLLAAKQQRFLADKNLFEFGQSKF